MGDTVPMHTGREWCMGDLPNVSELHAQTEQNLFDFLQADSALCATFADLVLTELRMDDREAAQRVLAKSEEGYATIARLLPNLKDSEHRNDIEQKLKDLRTKLDNVQRHFSPGMESQASMAWRRAQLSACYRSRKVR
jgi:hypothetical protein